MCRRVSLELEPTPQAAALAREFVETTCLSWGVGELIEDVKLGASELVTNAVLHARTSIRVELCIAQNVLELSVADDDPQPPVSRPPRVDLLADLDAVPLSGAETDARHQSLHVGASGSVTAGRGLLIVDAIASDWGVNATDAGKEVWLTMPVPAGQSCPCVDVSLPSRPGQGFRLIAD
jgi:hypothetical protein